MRTLHSMLSVMALVFLVPLSAQDVPAPVPVPGQTQTPKKAGLWDNLSAAKVEYRKAELDSLQTLHYVEITLNHSLDEAEGYKAEVSCWVLRGEAQIAKGARGGVIRFLWLTLPGDAFPENLHINIAFSGKGTDVQAAMEYHNATVMVEVPAAGVFEQDHQRLKDVAIMHREGRYLGGSLLHRRAFDALCHKAGFDREADRPNRWSQRAGRPDLMAAFTAALAVEESLQLGAMVGEGSLEEPRTQDGAGLKGPTIKSHPWAEMNAQKKDHPSKGGIFSEWCPADHFLAEARDLEGLLRLQGKMEGWCGPLRSLAGLDGKDAHLRERLLGRVGLGDSELAKTFGPAVIGETAVIASDFFFFEGTSFALAFKLKEPQVFANYLNLRNGAGEQVEVAGHGVTLYRKGAPGAFWLLQEGDVAILVSHESLLKAILAARSSGGTMAKAPDYEYIRRLQPRSEGELAFIFFSDDAMRKWLSPRWKILERRRMLALMKMTDAKLGDLLGEKIEAASSTTSEYGQPWSMTPVADLPFDKISNTEAAAYASFLSDYSNYWSRYFDPIGIQVLEEGKILRVKTVVLPLIQDGYYDEAQKMLAGLEPQPAAGAAEGELFSVSCKVPKREILRPVMLMGNSSEGGKAFNALTGELLVRVFDGEPVIYFDATQVGQWGRRGLDDMAGAGAVISFLTMPSSIELRHTDEKAVKKILTQLPDILRTMDSEWGQLRHARIQRPCGEVDVYAFTFFGMTLRYYFWVNPTHVVIANRPEVLEAVSAVSQEPVGPKGHLHLSWSPSRMKKLRLLMNLSRAESGHHACWTAQAEKVLAQRLQIKPDELALIQGCERVCPEGEALEAGKPCRRHGEARDVPLINVGEEASPLPDVRVHLSLTEEGLWSEMEIEGR